MGSISEARETKSRNELYKLTFCVIEAPKVVRHLMEYFKLSPDISKKLRNFPDYFSY